ncbi:MAG TPA: helix-turn-helix domain-containing protein [Pyrinomonadaceae bacterium]|nr:helix-turn-helix domain-containing protein [Pyrinomonadaceae bacterium]
MKKTQSAKRSQPSARLRPVHKPSDGMQLEYKFDYRTAKVNRFASKTTRRDIAVVLGPNIEAREKLVQHLRSVPPTRQAPNKQEAAQVSDRVQGLKDLALTLLMEVQALEHDEALAERATLQEEQNLEIKEGIVFHEMVARFETNIIIRALELTGGNQARAARLLGMKPSTLNYKIKLYNISET